MGATSGSPAVVAPEIVFKRIAVVCAIGMVVIAISARPHSPTLVTLISLGLMTAISYAVARKTEATPLRAAAIVVLAALATPLGYFFGPNSAYAAILAILLAITGLLSARQSGLRSRTGWLVLAVICLGQLIIVVLVAYDVIDDRSLSPIRRVWPAWRQVSAHLAAQAVYLCAFFAGRAAQKRYRRVVFEAIDATRTVAIREALLDEARADYERALALQERAEATTAEPSTAGVSQQTTPRTDTAEAATTRDAKPRPSVLVIDDARSPWSKALQSKLRVQDAFVLGACMAGVYYTATLIKSPTPRVISLIAIIGIAAMVASRALIHYSRPNAVVQWPYPVIAFLSCGPAYGFGLHAAFSAIVATVVFAGRLFRSAQSEAPNSNLLSLYCVCISHATMFVLVYTGVLPDTSNLPLFLPDSTPYAPILSHVMVQGVYIASYLAGGRIDREFVHATTIAREAYADAARADAKLRVAHSALDAALKSEGLFTGTAVGDYQLKHLLGRGGMGEVYQAEANGKLVALKLLRSDKLGDPAALERFKHEAKLLMHVASPYCARVIEVSSDDAVPYLAMEYVEGPSLSLVLRERGRMTNADLAALVDDLTRGLADVHEAGVVHLDLKPSNVLRGGERWMIVDFGIARMITGEAHRKIAGTPPYMAPEQALGEPVDTRTDLYSLSLILYRAITGRPAYVGTDAAVIAQRARTIGPPDPREAAAIDDDLALVLRIGLAAAQRDRFVDTADVRDAFIGALEGRLSPRIRTRGLELLARAPWAMHAAVLSGSHSVNSLRSTR